MRDATVRGQRFCIRTPRLSVQLSLRQARSLPLVTPPPFQKTRDWEGWSRGLWMLQLPHQDCRFTETHQDTQDKENQCCWAESGNGGLFCQCCLNDGSGSVTSAEKIIRNPGEEYPCSPGDWQRLAFQKQELSSLHIAWTGFVANMPFRMCTWLWRRYKRQSGRRFKRTWL